MNYIKTLIILSVSALSISVASPASADYLPGEKSAAEQVDGYEMVLSYLESANFFPSRLEFRKLSADAVGDLARVATDKRIKSVIRGRAIQSLALYDSDDRAVEAIDTLIATTNPGTTLFPAVVIAYAQIHGEGSAELMTELASHRRSDVRLAAVIALGRFGGQDGYEALLRLQGVEKNDQVRETIASYTN